MRMLPAVPFWQSMPAPRSKSRIGRPSRSPRASGIAGSIGLRLAEAGQARSMTFREGSTEEPPSSQMLVSGPDHLHSPELPARWECHTPLPEREREEQHHPIFSRDLPRDLRRESDFSQYASAHPEVFGGTVRW